MNWVVAVTETMKEKARLYEQEVLKSLRGSNYTGLSAKRRYYKGYVGEQSFKELLERSGKRYVWYSEPGQGDLPDFILYHDGREGSVNVKTRYHGNGWLLNASRQFRVRHTDIYVGGRIVGDYESVKFIGWAKPTEFEQSRNMKVPTMVCKQPHLMSKLWTWIDSI